MTAEEILKALIELRVARRAKFIPYDLDRRMKRKEKDIWKAAEEFFNVAEAVPQPKPLRPNRTRPAKAA